MSSWRGAKTSRRWRLRAGLRRLGRLLAVFLGGMLALAAVGLTVVAVAEPPRYKPYRVSFAVQHTPEQARHGERLARLMCVECHLGLVATDSSGVNRRVLSGQRVADLPAAFGVVYSSNITQHSTDGIGAWSDADVAVVVRTGLRPDGSYTPPWMPKRPRMADDDVAALVAYLRSADPLVRAVAGRTPPSRPSLLAKLLLWTTFRPLPWPAGAIRAPPKADEVAYGRYLVNDSLDCFGCHSADFKSNNALEPEASAGYLAGGNRFIQRNGELILSANLTTDNATGLGAWTYEQFRRAVVEGFRPGGGLVRYPMRPMRHLLEAEVKAIWAYLRSVPAVRHRISRPAEPDELLAEGHPGRIVYQKYGCPSCHGHDGSGVADIRQALRHYADDEALAQWIRNPAASRPGVAMPGWQGVMHESEYAPLVAYLRVLEHSATKVGGEAQGQL